MNVWIFVISALFTPVVEPLGLSMEQLPSVSLVEAEPALASEAEPTSDDLRFHGIERLFAQLEAAEPTPTR